MDRTSELIDAQIDKKLKEIMKQRNIRNPENSGSDEGGGSSIGRFDYSLKESFKKKWNFPPNQIFFGAPGTGKSFTLNNQKDELISDESDYERVTFHPDYSYANFVGTYKPVPLEDDKTKITYKYVPGPFLRLLVKALKNLTSNEKTKPFLLLIEEINRANVSAVFGDIFQLLDRDENNWSEFPIDTTEDMINYLESELKDFEINCEKLYLPNKVIISQIFDSAYRFNLLSCSSEKDRI